MELPVCGICGFISFKGIPDSCPVCGAPKEKFSMIQDAVKKPADPDNLTEGDRKHIPVIQINRQCGLAGAGCIDANVKVGELLHVMEEKHYIMYIDLYLDKDFIARYHLSAGKLNPIVGVHLKTEGGTLLALESCNVHGRWTAEAVL